MSQRQRVWASLSRWQWQWNMLNDRRWRIPMVPVDFVILVTLLILKDKEIPITVVMQIRHGKRTSWPCYGLERCTVVIFNDDFTKDFHLKWNGITNAHSELWWETIYIFMNRKRIRHIHCMVIVAIVESFDRYSFIAINVANSSRVNFSNQAK